MRKNNKNRQFTENTMKRNVETNNQKASKEQYVHIFI